MAENNSIFEFGEKFKYKSVWKNWTLSDSLGTHLNRKSTYSLLGSINKLPAFSPTTNVEDVFYKIGSSENEKHILFDYSGTVSRYENNDNAYASGLEGKVVKLPSGTRVAKIGKCQINNNRFYVVILFWNGAYREGLISASSIKEESQYLFVDKNSLEIFINDVERIVYEIEIKKDSDKKTDDKTWIGVFANVKEKIKILKGNKKIGNKFIENLNKYYKNESIIGDDNKVTSYNKLTSNINTLLKKYIESYKFLFIPISTQWFEEHDDIEELKDYIKTISVLPFNLYEELSVSKSGWVPHTFSNKINEGGTDSLVDAVKYINTLMEIINKHDKLKSSPEGKWLLENSNRIMNLPSNNGCIIFVGNATWFFEFWKQKYAESVGVLNCVGHICCPPLLTILLHELDQGISKGNPFSYLPGDTHVSPQLTKEIIDEIGNNPPFYFSKTLIFKEGDSGRYKSDFLFQCNAFLIMIFAGLLFEKYMK
jgi:hypothetical protein